MFYNISLKVIAWLERHQNKFIAMLVVTMLVAIILFKLFIETMERKVFVHYEPVVIEVVYEDDECHYDFSVFYPAVQRWREYIVFSAHEFGLCPLLLAAVIQAESSGIPNQTSRTGAFGLTQIMPATARDMGVKNIREASELMQIYTGARYLRWLMERTRGNELLAVAAYNAGIGNVWRYRGIPPFRETQNYVQKISSVLDVARSNIN